MNIDLRKFQKTQYYFPPEDSNDYFGDEPSWNNIDRKTESRINHGVKSLINKTQGFSPDELTNLFKNLLENFEFHPESKSNETLFNDLIDRGADPDQALNTIIGVAGLRPDERMRGFLPKILTLLINKGANPHKEWLDDHDKSYYDNYAIITKYVDADNLIHLRENSKLYQKYHDDYNRYLQLCSELGKNNLTDLKDLAKSLQISGYSNMNKKSLCDSIAASLEVDKECVNPVTLDMETQYKDLDDYTFYFDDGKKFCFSPDEIEHFRETRKNPYNNRLIPFDYLNNRRK